MPFWSFDYRPAPAARAGAYRRKYGTTWWGAQFLEALERADNTGRLSRGKTYANKGLVLNIENTGPEKLSAQIQGSMPRPYRIQLAWKPWRQEQSEAVVQAITDDAALLAGLLAGELPAGIVDAVRDLGLTIFPEDFSDLGLNCSCPDYATPCKHQAALLYVIAADIDNDPNQLFRLRGLDLPSALVSLRSTGGATIPKLYDRVRDITDAPDYQWDEATYQSLHFDALDDAGRRSSRPTNASKRCLPRSTMARRYVCPRRSGS